MTKLKEHIVKTGGGYKLVSKSTGKNLGTAKTKAGIMKRERQVQYFKHMHEDGGMGMVGGSPVNSAGSGAIAGIGIGPQGEPGVNMKKKKAVVPFKTFVRKRPV